jgi:Ca2+-binding RTX toxin-like protein
MTWVMAKLFIIVVMVLLVLFMLEYQAMAQMDTVNHEALGGIMEQISDLLDSFVDTEFLDKITDTKCVMSTLTEGKDGIVKNGQLVFGTDCDDNIIGDNKNEIIYSFDGTDSVFAGNGDDIIYGDVGDDKLHGEGDDDIIMPSEGSNVIDGGVGNDILFGGVGNNILIGDKGDDILIAGNGSTIMEGGSGTNSFECNNNSIVLDYNPEKGDIISSECNVVYGKENQFSN